jgi:LPXTG-site transpeptidase (sortase) family protein
MTPDSTSCPANRAALGPARFIAALALVAVAAACGSGNDDVTAVESTAQPTPSMTVSPRVTQEPREPTTALTASPDVTQVPPTLATTQADGIEGRYTLRIPRIGLDAPVVPVKSNKDRVLEPPRDPSVAGWWSDGAAPGEPQGSAVLVGHTVRNDGGGVFDDIGDLSRGDAIQVEGSDSTLTYRVKSIDVLSKDEVARNAEEIFAQTGAGRLVIVTCDDWDGMVWRSNIVTIAAPA